ncbi:transcription factor S-II, central domain-containing protein [Aspergillus bertholletiae]|uniref:Transcription factor BYE1 n=1 Tax=Aspergillus bertholletiae TaxID=1226010 RepID=A0A5N7B500_9EURO|nr:transcription factor S-II, central domain-containing protein [Aspergillus bertholletiae]
MTEEPRRSGRSTKGQHKNLDLIPETPAKKPKSKTQPKEKPQKPSVEPTPAPSEEDEIIRCICGEYEEEEDIERDMICCDRCSAWQHNDCMGLTFAKGEEPDEYFCEICKPENHKVLLDKIARGEKPWEEAAEKRRKEAEEKKASRRRKGKKGGRRGRPSEPKPEPKPEPKTEASTPARTAASLTPAPAPASTPAAAPAPPAPTAPLTSPAPPSVTPVTEKNGAAPDARSASAQKRKFSEHQDVSTPEPTPKSKQQKVSPPADIVMSTAEPTQVMDKVNEQPSRQNSTAEMEVVEGGKTLEELSNPARKSAASALVRLFVDQVSEARRRGSFSLSDGKSAEEVARQLALSIENAMYENFCGGSGETTEQYKAQLRTILFNVKKNPSLRDRLLVGSLLPDTLSKMSSQDMASEELQQKDAEIKREAERQHIIVQEQGPRIRRTHKGEELVEDDNQNVSSEPVFSAAPRRSLVDADGSQSPGPQQSGDGDSARKSGNQQASDSKPTDGISHDQHFPPRAHSPGGTELEQVFPEMATHIRQPLPTGKAQADAEIDQLLKDDEPESPPYSPKDYHDEGTVWRGKVIMNPIAEFSSSAKHVGGADLSGRIPWSQLAPSTLLVDGRIDIQLASEYLCNLRFSTSTDVSVICISRPELPKEQAGFDKLFNYFSDRKRYGVVGKHPLAAVKDTYLIPIEAGSTKKPEFIELLENNTLEDPTPERVLLVVFAVKTSESNPPSVQPSSHHPSQEPMTSASPATPQQQQFMTPGPRPVSQITPAPSNFDGTPLAHTPYGQQQHQVQHQHPPQAPKFAPYQSPAPQNQAPITGLAAAVQVLGTQANSPAIQQLLQQAPNADVSQLSVVRDILLRRPETALNYEILMQELVQATTNGHTLQQNAK